MAASLKGIDVELKNYLYRNRLPDIYEALLTGLAIHCPEDPFQYMIECLSCVEHFGYGILQWDAFVVDFLKPSHKSAIVESALAHLFNFDDSQPTPEMIMQAYSHYNRGMKKLGFDAWMRYHLYKRRKRMENERKLIKAATYYAHRKMRLALHQWIEWKNFRLGRQCMAHNIIENVFHKSVTYVIFGAWLQVTLDARRTREYFEKLGRGEIAEEDEPFGKGTGEARDDIAGMDREDAVLIFRHLNLVDLSRCACVCRAWKEITEVPNLWRRINFSEVRNSVTDKIACKLLMKSRSYVTFLNLRRVDSVGWDTFKVVSECRNLQDLNVSECIAFNDDLMKLISEGCRSLLYLNISYTNVTDGACRLIAKGLTNLSFLSLSYCHKVTNRGLEYLGSGKGAKRFVYIDLSGCHQLTALGIKSLTVGCTGLKHLIFNDFPTLDDNAVLEVTRHTKVQDVSFLGTQFLTDDAFKSLATIKSLQRIRVEANQLISDTAMKLIGKLSSNLTHVYLSDCQRITDHSLKALSACRNLAVLNVTDCVRITDTGVRHLMEGPSGPKIRELNLTNCIRVGDIALVNIHKRSQNLAYLSLCFCEHISEAGIELLGQTHSLISLDISGCACGDQGLSALGNNTRFRDVTLADCNKVTDLGLQKFAQQCKDINRLSLAHCRNLTDGAIKNLAFCCRLLNVLDLAGCKLLTDQSVQYLSGVCHYLRELNMSGCILLTDKAMRYLRKGCKNLRSVSVLYCKAISKRSVQKMLVSVPRVEWTDDEVPAHFNY
ncbi:F-box and leucine-rich repeat protein 13-like isoform X2 [Watersipora subatra]|uniref:F-box and leucine-rich repeat protein 13-like isoform X2 n=1 Tax=Watersipora subatra TaxID=2589382 RepID=UPI00355AF59E